MKKQFRRQRGVNPSTQLEARKLAEFFKDHYINSSDMEITFDFSGNLAALFFLLERLLEEELGLLELDE